LAEAELDTGVPLSLVLTLKSTSRLRSSVLQRWCVDYAYSLRREQPGVPLSFSSYVQWVLGCFSKKKNTHSVIPNRLCKNQLVCSSVPPSRTG